MQYNPKKNIIPRSKHVSTGLDVSMEERNVMLALRAAKLL